MLLLAVFLAVGTAGCKKSPKNVTTIEGRRDISPRPENLTGLKGNTDGRNGVNSGNSKIHSHVWIGDNVKIGNANLDPSGLGSRPNPDDVTEDPLILASQTVSFEYDKSSVKSSERSKVEAAAAYLKNEPRFLLKVEGHCDERGTDEYNRALGERRALSIREYLLTLGVSADRVTTISYGKDRPAVQGHDEAAYSQNRRGAFVVLKPKQ